MLDFVEATVEVNKDEFITLTIPSKFCFYVTTELSIYLGATATDLQAPTFFVLTKLSPESERKIALVLLNGRPVYSCRSA